MRCRREKRTHIDEQSTHAHTQALWSCYSPGVAQSRPPAWRLFSDCSMDAMRSPSSFCAYNDRLYLSLARPLVLPLTILRCWLNLLASAYWRLLTPGQIISHSLPLLQSSLPSETAASAQYLRVCLCDFSCVQRLIADTHTRVSRRRCVRVFVLMLARLCSRRDSITALHVLASHIHLRLVSWRVVAVLCLALS